MKIGFGNEEKKLRWGLSTRVLNFVGGTPKKNYNIGPFSRGGLEKPNPARTIDTLADGSSGDPQLNVEGTKTTIVFVYNSMFRYKLTCETDMISMMGPI